MSCSDVVVVVVVVVVNVVVLMLYVESYSVLANSRVAATQRCLHRLKHLIDLLFHTLMK